jgi:hypothetical protein
MTEEEEDRADMSTQQKDQDPEHPFGSPYWVRKSKRSASADVNVKPSGDH